MPSYITVKKNVFVVKNTNMKQEILQMSGNYINIKPG